MARKCKHITCGLEFPRSSHGPLYSNRGTMQDLERTRPIAARRSKTNRAQLP
jgi:hypothetical protein